MSSLFRVAASAVAAMAVSACAGGGFHTHRINQHLDIVAVRCADLDRTVAADMPGCEEFMTLEISDADTGETAEVSLDGPRNARALFAVRCSAIRPDRIDLYPDCILDPLFAEGDGPGFDGGPGDAPSGGERGGSAGTGSTEASASSGPGGDSAGGSAGSASASAERSTDSAGNETTSGSASTSNTSASVSDDSVSATAGSQSISLSR